MYEGVNDGLSCYILEGYGLRPSSVSVDDCQKVFVAIGFGHCCEVGMEVEKTLLRDLEIANVWDSVAANFGPLTMGTGSGPSRYVSSNGWPDEFVRDHLPCSIHARVPQAVDAVEHPSSPRKRDERTRQTIGDVHYEVLFADADLSK